MKHFKAFAERVKNATHNPAFYQNVVTEPRGKAIWFLFWANVVAITVFAISVLVVLIPAMIDFSKNTYVTDLYPDDLVVEIKGGIATVNQPVPYLVATREEFEIDNVNFFVIDTSDGVSMDTIKSYDSFAVLTKDSVYVEQNDNEMRVFSLRDAGDVTINEENVETWTNTAEKWTYVAVLPLTLMMIGMLAGFSLVYYLVVSFVLALIPLLVGKILKLTISYRSAYIISLYALIPVVVVDMVAMLMGTLSLPFMVTVVIFTFFLVFNLRGWKKEEDIPAVSTSDEVSPLV